MNLFDMPLEEMKKYKPELTKKKDFDEFWDNAILSALKQPLNMIKQKMEYPVKNIEYYEIYFDGFDNSRIRTRYVIPSGIKNEKIPTIIMFHGYNWNNIVVSNILKYSLMGYAVMMVDVRGQNSQSPDFNHYTSGSAAGWMTKGILDKNNYYYKYVFMDCVRVIECIKSLPNTDKSKIILEGGSQGGALTLATAALSKDVKIAMADVPYLSCFKRSIELCTESPYLEIYHYFKIHDQLHKTEEIIFDTLSYFDCLNLSKRITADTLISVGLEDNICPPSTVFAVFNHINSYKEIRIYPDFGHGGFSFQDEEKINFLIKRL